jgi:hypothetical protein
MTDPTFEDIKSMMPNKLLPSIGSATHEPTRLEITTVLTQLAENAASVPSERGDGQLGHAYHIIGAIRYTALSVNNTDFNPPPMPPINPVIRANATRDQIDESNRLHAKQVKEYKTYMMVQIVCRTMLLEAIHAHYKSDFFTTELGYRVGLTALIDHLKNTYCKKSDKELETNKKEMKEPWNAATTPIQALFARIEQGILFDDTIPMTHYVRDTANIICKNNGFESAFENWDIKPEADKTWINLKLHFGSAARVRKNKIALQDNIPYPGAANATITSPGTPPVVPPTLDSLIATVAGLTTQVNSFMAATTTGGGGSRNTDNTPTGPRRPRTTNPAGGREPTPEEATTMDYCWSHGFCKVITGKPNHTSVSCKAHRIGHKSEATATNKMDGETRICNSWHREPIRRRTGNNE